MSAWKSHVTLLKSFLRFWVQFLGLLDLGLHTKPLGGVRYGFIPTPLQERCFDTVIYHYLPYHMHHHMLDMQHLQKFLNIFIFVFFYTFFFLL